MNPRHAEELIFRGVMYGSVLVVLGSLAAVFLVVFMKGASALDIDMVTRLPEGGYYLGREGGILNAIIGSLMLASGALILATAISIPIAWYLQNHPGTRFSSLVRGVLDILTGIPSLVYGAFVFLIMVYFQARASLFFGMITVAIFITPLITRAVDEVMRMVPPKIKEASSSIGATRLETLLFVVTRQALPGIITAVLLAFGRGIGDAASVLFTAGYTDEIPQSLGDPVATLPLAIFYQLGSPFPEVQNRAYASGIILLCIVLLVSAAARYLSKRATRYVIK